VLVLDRIATGLGTSIARLLGKEQSDRTVVLRRDEQDVARDASGWERRVLSPVLPGVEFELMRTTVDAGVDAGVFQPHGPGSREYLAVEAGALRLSLDGEEVETAPGRQHLLRRGLSPRLHQSRDGIVRLLPGDGPWSQWRPVNAQAAVPAGWSWSADDVRHLACHTHHQLAVKTAKLET
jgi:hypothetical protein